jgi:MATE family multidrug resistance protein
MAATRREISILTRLAIPIVGTQVGAMLMGVVDTLMLASVGPAALGAAALGNTWIWATLILADGIVRGIDPIVAQAHGARDGESAALALQRGIVIALAISLPLVLLWLFTEEFLLATGQSPELASLARSYVLVQIPSIPCHTLYMALRCYLQSRGIMTPALWVMLLSNLGNVFANWVLIFGHLGAPALGVVGAGIATSLNRFLAVGALAGLTLSLRLHEGAWRPWSRAALAPAGLRRILALGLPVGLQVGLEVWAFGIATLMAGNLGVHELAGHQIVLNMASLTFMVPLGIAIAASTRVGNLIGAGHGELVQRASWGALGLGAGSMAFFGVLMVALREQLPRIYTDDVQVIAVCAFLLPIAAAFQIFDGTQVVGCGVLRGMGRTRAPALVTLVGYYALALPVAWWLGFERELGLAGIWWGLCVGLVTVASALLVWVRRSGSGERVRF